MTTKRERLPFIDVLRLIATVQMIQGHAVSAVLAPAYEQGPLFAVWLFARGLTSVMFLFAAGYSFALAGAKRGRWRRALMLIAIGYLMHAPVALWLGAPREPTLRASSGVDVLQCIGVSLLGLEALARVRHRVALALALGAALIACAPWLSWLHTDGALRLLTNYLTSHDGSLFPLLPWSGYVLVGFALGSVRATGRVLGLAAAGSGLLAAGWRALEDSTAPRASYGFLKLACVLGIAATLARLCRGWTLPPRLAQLSRETLFLYVSHVLILYADQVGLEARWRDQRGPWFGAGLALVLLVACSAGALAWRSLRAGGTKPPLEA
jgi:uncharacterized membrane protein